MIICKICNKELTSFRALGIHLNKSHKNCCGEVYYEKYLKKPNEGICVCGNKCNFISLALGYHKFCSHNCQVKNTIETAKKTKESHFGVGKYISAEGIAKISETNKKNSKQRNEERQRTCINKYGCKAYSQTEECKQKVKQTLLTKYGDENYHNVAAYNETCIKRYGVKNFMQRKDINPFYKYEEKTGYKNPFSNPEIHEKRKQNNLNKYGVEYTSQLHNTRIKSAKKYEYNNIGFDSKWELAYYIWLKEHDIDFVYQPDVTFKYTYNDTEHVYHPDFMVNTEIHEIKGLQFFKDGNINANMVNPFNHAMDEHFEAKHQCMIENNVKIITDCTEYIKYVEEKYTKDFLNLFKNDLEFPYPNNDIIKKYHHSIYDACIKNKPSPKEAWQDKNLVLKCALNRLKYVSRCKPADIIQGFNVAKIAPKVSVFKSSLAERLINTYLSEYDEIFDPFSGFSGRLLGANACGKTYIGQDINETHVNESNSLIINEKINNATVICKDIFESNGNYDCLFTCPPYGLKEQWNENETDMSCDEWIDECLKRFSCKRYVFVVDKTEKYKDKIVETLKNKSHFGTNQEYVLVI